LRQKASRANQATLGAGGAGISAASLGSGSIDLEALAFLGAGVSGCFGVGATGLRQNASRANQALNFAVNRFKDSPLPVCTFKAAHSIAAKTGLN
jgi:hypothetical protein